jgi:cytosol aminopeptidase
MSNIAYVVPYDHQPSPKMADGVDASQLWSLTPQGEKLPKVGTLRTFYNTPPSKVTTISSLGEGFASKISEAKRELVRKSVGSAVKDLKALDGLKDVLIDASADPHAAGVSLYLIHG